MPNFHTNSFRQWIRPVDGALRFFVFLMKSFRRMLLGVDSQQFIFHPVLKGSLFINRCQFFHQLLHMATESQKPVMLTGETNGMT
jgi:hypothetical protein